VHANDLYARNLMTFWSRVSWYTSILYGIYPQRVLKDKMVNTLDKRHVFKASA